MNLEEKRSKSIAKYYKQVDRAVKKNMPWEDIDTLRDAVYKYSELCEETLNREVNDDDIETLDDLLRILEKEVRKYHGKRKERRTSGGSEKTDARV